MQSYEIDLSTYKGKPFLLRFRFDSGTSFAPPPGVGWWVDDINVDGATWSQIGTTAGSTTSLNITNKPGGHYFYRVSGNYMVGSLTAATATSMLIYRSLEHAASNVARRVTCPTVQLEITN
jgi:hypothetical protein